jgi:ATP-binding cassette subfamily F protein 3
MITITGLKKSFGAQVLFEDLNVGINRRERVGLVGRNGHGKTTLFRLILGEMSPDEGEIAIPKRYRIGYLDQHIRFACDTVLEEACLGLLKAPAHGDPADQTWKAEKILSGLGFTQADLSRSPHVFSGGYQVRLNLAKTLLSEPDLLLLDEPTNYLDVVSIRWLSRFLRAWPSELLLITHDRRFMDSVTTHTISIHRKRARKIEGSTDKLYTQILEEEEIYEKTRANDEKKRKEIERFIERFRAKNTLATRVQSRIKFLEKHERLERLDRIQTLDFSFNAAPFPAKVMMTVDGVAFAYDGGPEILSNFSIEVQAQDRICVIGQNGKGKSTLLRLLAGDLRPKRGEVRRHPRLVTGYFAQTNVDRLRMNQTVVDEIRSGDRGCLPQTARNIAGAMMFEGDDALKKVAVLSGGEKSRVMLGRLLVSPNNLLLLDEPTNHLDMDSCDSLLAAVDAFDGAVVMVTHNEMFLHTLATRFVVFDRGRIIVFDHSYQDFLDNVGWEMDDTLRAKEPAREKARPSLDKKALRQARAKILQERSKSLGPLEKRIKDSEERIVALEKQAEAVARSLDEASRSSNGDAIADLARRGAEIKAKIDKAFDELESANRKLEKQSESFERRLEELS